MARQLAARLAALLPTHCPAEIAGRDCPWGSEDCIERADARGHLVTCWQAVLAAFRRRAGPGAAVGAGGGEQGAF